MDLTRYAKHATVQLTTKGRKSGQPRTVKIWFVVTAPNRLEVQHVSNPIAQWYKNLVVNPDVTLDFGDGPIAGKATAIKERAQIDAVLGRVRKKHWVMGPLIQKVTGGSKPVAAVIDVS